MKTSQEKVAVNTGESDQGRRAAVAGGKRLLITMAENGIVLHPADGCAKGTQPGPPEFSFAAGAFPSSEETATGTEFPPSRA